jgi:hypothetical protein
VGHIKTRKLLLLDWKSNTMLSYCETISYNSSPNYINGATSLSIIPTKKSFMFFLYLWSVGKNLFMIIKKMFYYHLLGWRSCYFLYNMNMLISHACSNQKPSHMQENFVSSSIICQSPGWPQLLQLISKHSKTNIYISIRTIRIGFDDR